MYDIWRDKQNNDFIAVPPSPPKNETLIKCASTSHCNALFMHYS